MGCSTDKETRLSEQSKYRKWTPQQKLEIVLAGLRGDRSVREVCRQRRARPAEHANVNPLGDASQELAQPRPVSAQP